MYYLLPPDLVRPAFRSRRAAQGKRHRESKKGSPSESVPRRVGRGQLAGVRARPYRRRARRPQQEVAGPASHPGHRVDVVAEHGPGLPDPSSLLPSELGPPRVVLALHVRDPPLASHPEPRQTPAGPGRALVGAAGAEDPLPTG